MDLQKIISDVLGKLNGDSGLIAKFKKDPIGTVKSLIGTINLDTDQLNKVVEGVKAKLNLDDVVKNSGGFLAKLKGLFSKK